MNLYRVEYIFNQDKYKADTELGSVLEGWKNPQEVFDTLPTHVLSDSFFSACDRAKSLVTPNPYLSVDRVIHLETNIRLLS